MCSGEGEGQHGEDAASGAAVMMSTYATGSGDVGVAYVNTAFRNLGLLEFQLADLEGVVVQVIFYRLLHLDRTSLVNFRSFRARSRNPYLPLLPSCCTTSIVEELLYRILFSFRRQA